MKKKKISRFPALIKLFRFNRTIMVAMISATAAFISGANSASIALIAVVAFFLAIGGFSMDFYADRKIDMKSTRGKLGINPIASGIIAPDEGFIFSLIFIFLSFFLVIFSPIKAFIFWLVILLIIILLARHVFETPFSRAVILGLLQALYFMMGGVMAKPEPAIYIIASMFFFAMFGARGITDIRDYADDKKTKVKTLTKKFGLKNTAIFTAISLLVAFALSFIAYFTGKFSPVYLYLDIIFIIAGLILTAILLKNPVPKTAYYLTLIFMIGEGTLICLAMILGSL